MAITNDSVAWSSGKQAFVRTAKGDRTLELPSSVGGLAFAPKGFRLAIAHYNGATLWFPNAPDAKPDKLGVEGLAPRRHVQPGRALPRHRHAGVDAARLASRRRQAHAHVGLQRQGAPAAELGAGLEMAGDLGCRPARDLAVRRGKDGPMGKQPKVLSPADHRISAVAAHPRQEICAAGYEDGMILLTRVEDGAEVLAHGSKGSPITALGWNAAGNRLAFGTEDGEAGV